MMRHSVNSYFLWEVCNCDVRGGDNESAAEQWHRCCHQNIKASPIQSPPLLLRPPYHSQLPSFSSSCSLSFSNSFLLFCIFHLLWQDLCHKIIILIDLSPMFQQVSIVICDHDVEESELNIKIRILLIFVNKVCSEWCLCTSLLAADDDAPRNYNSTQHHHRQQNHHHHQHHHQINIMMMMMRIRMRMMMMRRMRMIDWPQFIIMCRWSPPSNVPT